MTLRSSMMREVSRDRLGPRDEGLRDLPLESTVVQQDVESEVSY